MKKIYKSHIHLALSRILNEDPDILLDEILTKVPEIKSRQVLQDALTYMEKSTLS